MGIGLLYLVSFIMSFLDLESGSFIQIDFLESVSLFVVGIAALNLVLDFDFIEGGRAGAAETYGMVWSFLVDGDFGVVIKFYDYS